MRTESELLTFAQPGPGGWKQLGDHFPGALTAEYQRLYAETCPPGMACYMRRYGVLARSVEVAYVHGHLYITPVPLVGPREMKYAPPGMAVWILSRLHPEFRKRTRAARRALAERPWRSVAAEWFAAERNQWVQRIRTLEDVDPAGLDQVRLVEHIRASRQLVVDGYRRHFELHGDDLLPIGLLIARCEAWGIDASTAMRALNGTTPASAATAEAPPWQLVTGYDLDSLAWCETRGPRTPVARERTEQYDLHHLVPTEHHEELDQLVDDARRAVPLRDDNGAITAAWTMGVLRRGMLEAGRRLVLAPPTLAVEATVDELVARLDGAGGPTQEQLLARQTDRARWSLLPAPASIGPEFALPPLKALPTPLALIGAAQLAAADHMFEGGGPVGIGTDPHTGRAVVVDDPNTAFDLIEPGDVVVTRSTSPSWNTILAVAGAVVTTTGGLVSHAAVIARELNIPAVIGDITALDRIATGAIVTVDPRAVTVTSAVPQTNGASQ